MRPSDLVRDFGQPVAYYPGLVKHFGSVNAAVLFCQFFYWTGKEVSELGIYKTTEEIEQETGLSYEEQLTARKKLKRRGVLKETNKRLEHRIYYRIDTDVLDMLLSQVPEKSPNGESPFRETGKAQPANTGKPTPPAGQSRVGGGGDPHFVHTENTTENTSEITIPVADKSAPAPGRVLTGEVLPKSKQAAPKEDQETAFQLKCRETWHAYGTAYQSRYGAAPVRNAQVNSQVKQLVQRLGSEAGAVAAFFVLNVNEAFVVRKMHPIGLLVSGAEAYRTQWATGNAMTGTRARQLDQSAANFGAADEAKAMLREKRARERGDNAE